nr:hypothetical protein [Tanacetum cinerariifolium]
MLSYGSKILPLGREEKIFRRSFRTRDGEKLLHAFRCNIYTTAGAITSILFISTEKVAFCSEKCWVNPTQLDNHNPQDKSAPYPLSKRQLCKQLEKQLQT